MADRNRLPDIEFFVIGAYKAATTTLHYALREHPDVFVPRRKEPSFLAFVDKTADDAEQNPAFNNAVRSIEEYRELFSDAPDGTVRGDVSPEYLKDPSCADTIARYYPDAKLVAILRNPVERAFSDYLMYKRDGIETEETFAAAIEAQPDRIGRAHGGYLETGMYGSQLSRYYEKFAESQILVLIQEDLRTNRDRTLEQLATFLGVSAARFPTEMEESNRSGIPTSRGMKLAFAVRRGLKGTAKYVPETAKRKVDDLLQRGLERPELPATDRAELMDYFAEDIALTEELTGLDLAAWRRAGF